MAVTLVSTVTVASTSSGLLSFTNIPQTGKDLLLLGSVRTNRSAVADYLELQLNAYGDSARSLAGNSSTVTSYTAGYVNVGNPVVNAANSTGSVFANVSAYISNYTSSTPKVVSMDAVGENNTTEANQVLSAGYKNTSAVTTLTARVESSFFVTNTVFSLYIIS